MDSLQNVANAYASEVLQLMKQYRVSLLVAASIPFIRVAYLDYRGWYALGAGGISRSPIGWITQCVLRLKASRDLKSTKCYDAALKTDLEGQSFLDRELPVRLGNAPKTGQWVVPHRQLDDTAKEGVKMVSF